MHGAQPCRMRVYGLGNRRSIRLSYGTANPRSSRGFCQSIPEPAADRQRSRPRLAAPGLTRCAEASLPNHRAVARPSTTFRKAIDAPPSTRFDQSESPIKGCMFNRALGSRSKRDQRDDAAIVDGDPRDQRNLAQHPADRDQHQRRLEEYFGDSARCRAIGGRRIQPCSAPPGESSGQSEMLRSEVSKFPATVTPPDPRAADSNWPYLPGPPPGSRRMCAVLIVETVPEFQPRRRICLNLPKTAARTGYGQTPG